MVLWRTEEVFLVGFLFLFLLHSFGFTVIFTSTLQIFVSSRYPRPLLDFTDFQETSEIAEEILGWYKGA